MSARNRACLLGCMLLALGCGGTVASDVDGGIDDAGTMPDADICESRECECEIDDDCGAHEVCESSPELGRICACAPAYRDTGSGCAFAGAPLAPGFTDAAPWSTSGGAVLDSSATGSDDPGEVRWPGGAICDDSHVSQTFAMPPLSRAEPLAFEITYRGQNAVFEARPQVGINGRWARFPRRDVFFTQATCLGEAGFGGDVQFWIGAISSFCPSSDALDELIVDRFEIVRAEDVGLDCPGPGVVVDGDFEADADAWTPLGDASVENGVGQDGSRAARLRTATLCSTAAITGTASLPLPSTLPSQALRFYWSGTAGRTLQVLVADSFVAELSATGEAMTSTVCLPPHTRGLARSVAFVLPISSGTCGGVDLRDFIVDSARTTIVVSEPDQNGGPALKYFYRAGNNPETSLDSRPGNGLLAEGAAGFVEETVCLTPGLATQPQDLVFTMQRSGPCGVAFPEEEAFVDNVRVTTDSACPSE